MTTWLDGISARDKSDAIIVALVVFAGIACFFGGLLAHAPTITRTVHVRTTSGLSSTQLVRALGKPDQTLVGTSVNPQLTGFTCGLWASKHLLACW